MSNTRIEAGQLNCEVIIQQDIAEGDSSLKGYTPEWVEFGQPETPVPRWVGIRMLNGREIERAAMLQVDATYMITMYWEPEITASRMRILFGSRIFNFGYVNNVDERNIKLEILASERIA